MAVARGKIVFGGLQMSEQLISRRGAFSLLGLGAALGFAVPTTLLTESDAEAQMQPTAPAPCAPAPTAPQLHEARRNARTKHRQARNAARMKRREARGKTNNLYMKSDTTKQKSIEPSISNK